MDSYVLILVTGTLTVFGIGINAHPFGFGFETGVGSKVAVKANTTGTLEPGWDKGITVDGKLREEASGSWVKNIFGKAYVVGSNGDVFGLSGRAGSVIDANAVGEVGAKAKTNIINTKIDKDGILDGNATYKAGVDVHFLDKSEVTGVEGVNKEIIKRSEETNYASKQLSQDSNSDARGFNSKDNVEYKKQEPDVQTTTESKGFLKRAWEWFG